MSIRIGIYDFFAYTIPGGLMLCIALGVLDTFGFPEVWVNFFNLNTLQIFLLIIGCYLTGFVISPILSKWSHLFEPKPFEQDIFHRFQKKNPALKMDINPSDWPVWFASIRRENLEMAVEIDRNMAIAKMIRGLSLFLLLGGIMIITNVFLGKLPVIAIVAVLLSFGCSFLSIKEAVRFKQRFYLMIFEAVVSRQEPFASTFEKKKKADK